ncbi:hypothetical protein B0H13DRAFT_2508201 [Mycena leptocephala]|nr:hypothetical protein B0H13DRAFT_2508201 [Mycena leptocephala]
MVNSSNDAQFASLYGRSPQGGTPSIASGFCNKNPGKGPCVSSASSAIEFCNGNPDTDPCTSLISANEFCQKNPTTGPCPSINSAVDGSDFCKQHPGTGPCPGAPGVSPPAGPQSSLPFSVPTAASFPASSPSETSPSSTSLTVQVTTSLTAQATTSLTAQVTTSNHRVDLTPILAGILIPAVLLALAGTIMILCRRQRARYAKDLESTRVHLPEPEWVQFHDPEPPAGAPGARVPGAAQNHHPEKRSRDDEQYLPAQASSSTILAGPGLSRAPTYRTLPSPPPHYFSDFQQQLLQLLRGNNVPAVRRSSV